MQINPENVSYYMKLIESLRLTEPEGILKKLEHYEHLFPRALAPQRLQLNYASGDKFKQLVNFYLRKGNLL